MNDEIQYPTGFSRKNIVAWGSSGLICLDDESQTVVKSPHDENNRDSLILESLIYERFKENGGHEGILQYYGIYESGIRLEYARNYNVLSFLKKHPNINSEQRVRWAKQIVNAVWFAHLVKVIHGDITANNVLITKCLDAKLADFGGCSLDGSELRLVAPASHRFPGPALSVRADIFAIGSTLYEIMAGVAPYDGRPEQEIKVLYRNGTFPSTESLGPIGDVITKCWEGKYNNAEDVSMDVEGMDS
jgi:serine/threonine protein kinase